MHNYKWKEGKPNKKHCFQNIFIGERFILLSTQPNTEQTAKLKTLTWQLNMDFLDIGFNIYKETKNKEKRIVYKYREYFTFEFIKYYWSSSLLIFFG